MNAVLTVDNQLLSHRISVTPLRLNILVDGSGARSAEESGVLLHIRLDVSGAGGVLDM